MMDFIVGNMPILLSAVGAFFAGGWFVWSRKKGAISAELANKEFSDVSSLVSSYTQRLGEMSNDITKLYDELTTVRQRQKDIEEENQSLREEVARMKQEQLALHEENNRLRQENMELNARLHRIENERPQPKD